MQLEVSNLHFVHVHVIAQGESVCAAKMFLPQNSFFNIKFEQFDNETKDIGNNLLLFYMYTMYVLPVPCLWTLRKTIQALIHRFVLFLIAG